MNYEKEDFEMVEFTKKEAAFEQHKLAKRLFLFRMRTGDSESMDLIAKESVRAAVTFRNAMVSVGLWYIEGHEN